MCGIVGYTGTQQAKGILIDGLQHLEYRGYDSAGIAVFNGKEIEVVRRQGKVAELVAALGADDCLGTCGIGHTRWATHGEPARSMRILMFLVIVRVLVPVKWNPKWSEYIMESLRIMRS